MNTHILIPIVSIQDADLLEDYMSRYKVISLDENNINEKGYNYAQSLPEEDYEHGPVDLIADGYKQALKDLL